MKTTLVSALCLLASGGMAMTVPMSHQGNIAYDCMFKVDGNQGAFSNLLITNVEKNPMVNVTSDKIKCTVVNDATYPWQVNAQGEVESVNKDYNSVSTLTFQLECAEPTLFSLDYGCSSSGYYDAIILSLDNTEIIRESGEINKHYDSGVLTEGKHTLTIIYSKDGGGSKGEDRAWFKNLTISTCSENVKTVNVSAPGTLGTEVLTQFSSLPDVKFLRINGVLNAEDFKLMKQMPNLKMLLLDGAKALEIPVEQFMNAHLQYITLPQGLKTIGDRAFYCSNYSQLQSEVMLPETLEKIGTEAFYNTAIVKCKLSNGVRTLGDRAFSYCSRLKEFSFNDFVKEVPANFLSGCQMLKNVYHTDSLRYLRGSSFNGCPELENVGNMRPEFIDGNAFYGCSKLKQIDLSKTTNVGNSCFSYCDSLKTIDLSSVVNIDNNAFYDCDGLTEVVLPDITEYMYGSVFSDCNNLQKVTLGASIAKLNSNVFSNCRNIKQVVCRAPAPPVCDYNVFDNSVFETATLIVPAYAVSSYKLDVNWSKFAHVEVHSDRVSDVNLVGKLDLASNARIPGLPNINQALDSHLTINGENPQQIGTYRISLANPQINSSKNNATLVSRCSHITANSSEVQTYMYGGYWYYVCYPFDVNMRDLRTSNGAMFAVRYYDGAQRAANGVGQSWVDVPADQVMKANQGYIVQVSDNAYFIAKAADGMQNMIFNSGIVEYPLAEHSSASSTDKNWNFVGNPYPAYFDIYYMDYSAPITVWNAYNYTYDAYSTADDEFALMPMQAFFVQRPDGVSTVKFNPEGRQETATIDHSLLPVSLKSDKAKSRRLVDLNLSNGRTTDRTRIVYNPESTDGYDVMTDAAKMMSDNAGVPQLYSWTEEAEFAINEGPHVSGRVNLGIYIPAAGSYTLSLHRGNMKVDLLDLQSGKSVDLSEPYVFTSNQGIFDNRFCLLMHNDEVTGVEIAETVANVVSVAGGVRVSGNMNEEVKVYTLDGRLVAVNKLDGDNQFIALSAGSYVVNVNGKVFKTLVH